MSARDLTQAQFLAALAKHGITSSGGGLGYYKVSASRSVCGRNGGRALRAQLAYLIHAKDEAAKDEERRAAFCALRDACVEVVQTVLACTEPMPFAVQDAAARCAYLQREYARLGGVAADAEAQAANLHKLGAEISRVLNGAS